MSSFSDLHMHDLLHVVKVVAAIALVCFVHL